MKKILLPLLATAIATVSVSALGAEAQIISSYTNAVLYKSDGTIRGEFMETSWQHGYGLNGGQYTDRLFDGDFGNYSYLNEAGCYLVVNLDTELEGGYYVTDIKIGHAGNTKYSLYYSEDGTTWTAIAEEVNLGGERTFGVEHMAKKVKYVYNTVISGTTSLAEIQVWGIPPSELECLHPEEFLTEWEPVPGTANCTEFGIDKRQCTRCGVWLQRESTDMMPLGHDYEPVLVESGTSLTYGSGTNVCKRCGHAVIFDEPRDLALLGGFGGVGIVQFTDVSVSSTYASWSGIPATAIIDNNWTWSWGKWWAASSRSHNEYVQFDFATTIDLTAVDLSVHNHNQVFEFYSLEFGEETLVGSYAVEEDTAEGAAEYQRIKVQFRGVSLSSLRIRVLDSIGYNVGSWGNLVIAISEIHPYGTVAGAGKTAAVRTRIIIE